MGSESHHLNFKPDPTMQIRQFDNFLDFTIIEKVSTPLENVAKKFECLLVIIWHRGKCETLYFCEFFFLITIGDMFT